MKRILLALTILLSMAACGEQDYGQPEPHLELGQRIHFLGGNQEQIYLVNGYRQQLEDKTESQWRSQPYIVFSYWSDRGEYMQGVIHRNTIQKR